MVKANIIQKTFKLLPSKVQYKLFKFYFFFLTFFLVFSYERVTKMKETETVSRGELGKQTIR